MVSAVTSPGVGAGRGPIPSGLAQPANDTAGVSGGATPSSGYAASPAALAADRQLQDALQALKTLRSQTVSASSAQRSAAKQKLEQLKAQLKALQEFGGDPKTRAREAAAIAKQIAQAAQEYADAGGDPGASSSAAQAATPVDGAPSGDAQAAGESGASPAQAGASSSAADVSGGSGATAAPDATGTDDASTAAAASPPPGDQATGASPASSTGGAAPQSAGAPAPGGQSAADQDFFKEARDLARLAKTIIDDAVRNLKATRHPVDPKIAGAADDALVRIQQAADQIGAAEPQGLPGLAAPATPTVSITA